jgi:head-tail adaptor
MTDIIGAMRARVRLESPTRGSDDIGGASITWANQGDVWAEIIVGGASQGADFDAAPSVGAYTLTINRRADVRAGWRIVWATRVFRILGVRDQGDARIELTCEEEIR